MPALFEQAMYGRGQIVMAPRGRFGACADTDACMLHEFLSSNRGELIQRCRAKVIERAAPHATSPELEHGVPLVLTQLVAALRHEETLPAVNRGESSQRDPAAFAESSRTNAMRGRELLEQGFTVEQVVHGYGDLCQAITELAKEKKAPVTVDEFHTLNRLLDHAIADAVSSYGEQIEITSAENAEGLHLRMGELAEEQRKLVETAQRAFNALKAGNIGVTGATGSVLENSLVQLRNLIDRSLPELRLSTGMTKAEPRR